jgi:hypothetical protein
MDIKLLQELSLTNRVLSLEERASDSVIKGDFQGSVTGYWKKLGERGEGIVSYKDKDYVSKPIGFVSLPAGTEVELSYANGIYYSKF